MTNKNDDVERYLKKLKHARKSDVLLLREIVLDSHKDLTEHIKWNAPSFCYNGEDRVTFRLQPKDRVELIFHRGAKVKETKGFSFKDSTGLIVWAAVDRGVVSFPDTASLSKYRRALQKLIKQWIIETTKS